MSEIEIQPNSDNPIELTNLKVDGTLDNGATVKMTLVKQSPLTPDTDSVVEDLGGTPNEVAIPSDGHGLVNNDQIYITGMENYNGVQTIKGTQKTLDNAAAVAVHQLEFSVGKSLYELAYTAGSEEPAVGDELEGATSGAKANVAKVVLDSGTWGGGDAAGTFWLESQSGTFQSENLNNNTKSTNDMATISSDSTKHNPEAGDNIKGGTSEATATIEMVDIQTGSFEEDNATGYLWIKNQTGSFSPDEGIRNTTVVSGVDIATASGDSTANQRTDIPCTAHGLSDGDYFAIKGSVNYDNANIEVLGTPDSDHIIIETDYVAETFTGNEILYYPANKLVFELTYTAEQLTGDEEIYVILPNATEISMTHGGADGHYSGTLPDTVK